MTGVHVSRHKGILKRQMFIILVLPGRHHVYGNAVFIFGYTFFEPPLQGYDLEFSPCGGTILSYMRTVLIFIVNYRLSEVQCLGNSNSVPNRVHSHEGIPHLLENVCTIYVHKENTMSHK